MTPKSFPNHSQINPNHTQIRQY